MASRGIETPIFAPLSSADQQETGAEVNLDEIFEGALARVLPARRSPARPRPRRRPAPIADCFAASEWQILNDTLSAEAKEAESAAPPLPPPPAAPAAPAAAAMESSEGTYGLGGGSCNAGCGLAPSSLASCNL